MLGSSVMRFRAELRTLFARKREKMATGSLGGTTLALVIVRPALNDIWTANLGDSDIYLHVRGHSHLEKLSEDHSPTSLQEFLRMKDFGTQVRFEYAPIRPMSAGHDIYVEKEGSTPIQQHPTNNVFYKNRNGELGSYLVLGPAKLSMTRSLGDFFWKQQGVSSVPGIKRAAIPEEDSIVIVGSDGFWDAWLEADLCKQLNKPYFGVEEIRVQHDHLTRKYFGNARDDTFVHFIRMSRSAD